MVFSSLTFLLLFLPLVVGAYFVRPSVQWKNGVLLAASLVFYAWGEPVWVFALIGMTFIVWACSLWTSKTEGKMRLLPTAAGVMLPMAVLLVVKYGGFLLAPVLAPFGIAVPQICMLRRQDSTISAVNR